MINVTKTYLPNIDKYKRYVDDIYESGYVTNGGKYVKILQKKLEDFLGVKHLILVSNGTLALQVAYKALELSGEVITTPFSFAATTSSMVWESLVPKFVDIDNETFNIDVNKIKNSICKNTSAIVPVHVFGNGCEVEDIDRLSKELNIKVIYDAAHAFGIKYKGKSILNYGDISTLSFHATKIFHTIEGGALIVNDNNLYEKIKLMINFGISGTDKIDSIGINAKMNEFQAAMGLCVLDDIDIIIKKRKEIYDYYIYKLPEKLQFQKFNPNCTNNYAYFPIVLESEELLLKLKGELNANAIYPRRYFYPSLDNLPFIKNKSNVPISNSISKRILCLPIYESLDFDSLKNIISIIRGFI